MAGFKTFLKFCSQILLKKCVIRLFSYNNNIINILNVKHVLGTDWTRVVILDKLVVGTGPRWRRPPSAA